MTIIRWILAIFYTLAFTVVFILLLKPGEAFEIGAIAGSVLSLVLSYAPGVGGWYDEQSAENKQIINIVLILVVSFALFGLGCAALADVGIPCSAQGVLNLAILVLFSIFSNASVYKTNNYLAAKVRARLSSK